MSFRVRASKFRHVFGKANKREECYDGIRVTRNAWDSPFIAVNAKFIAVVLEAQGGGSFIVVPITNFGRLDLNYPKFCGHQSAVLDIKFNPFNDNMIASCSEDCTVKVWQVPDDVDKQGNISDSQLTFVGHQRRVGIVEWHPTADGVLFSAGFDYVICSWNIATGEQISTIECHSDTIYSMSFNWDGSLMATTSKDKTLRVIDPRTGQVVHEGKGHEGTKASRVTWSGTKGKLITTGFSRMSERQFAVWDPSDLSKPLALNNIDTSSGVLFLHYDEDTGLCFLSGKGDGNIRYYEMVDERPYFHEVEAFKTSNPQRGTGWIPKRAVDVGKCEVARAYKLHPKGIVEPISFVVPRKSTMFQEDIFPPTKKDEPTMTAAEWLGGANNAPTRVSMKEGYTPPERAFVAPEQAPIPKEEQAPKGEKALLKAWHENKKEIDELKKKLASAEIKIRQMS